jgi:hypothetical protein
MRISLFAASEPPCVSMRTLANNMPPRSVSTSFLIEKISADWDDFHPAFIARWKEFVDGNL